MEHRLPRREFMKQGAVLGLSAIAGAFPLPGFLLKGSASPETDISVINGTSYFENTAKAIDALGGISAFVRPGNTVGLLINSRFDKPGAHANPDIALSILKLCLDAGAREVYSIENASASYWKESKLHGKLQTELGKLSDGGAKSTVTIGKGKAIKEAEISSRLIGCDVFINVPIVKNHEGTNFTGNLKNIMGATSGSTNRFFHQGSGKGGLLKVFRYYDDVEFLSQCIADASLIRKPDLCIVDATRFLTTNGPAGPGEIKKAEKIVAGRNPVSVDAYCATLLGLEPSDVAMIRFAQEHGLGAMDLRKLSIREA